MSNSTSSPAIDLTGIAGPVLLGALFNWGLYGVLSVQVYLYYLSFPKDSLVPRLLVYGVFLVDTAQVVLVTSDVFNSYARHYGDLEVLDSMQNEWLAVPVFSSIVSCTVQLYYAYRIGILSGSHFLRVAVSALALMAAGGGLAAGAQAYMVGRFSELEAEARVSTGIWLAGDATCDIIIAALMAYFLLRFDTKISETNAIVRRLVRLVVETGTLTALAATIDVILYYAFPHYAYHSCVATILAKLYSNSLLAIFNSRIRIVGSRDWTGSSANVHDVSYGRSLGAQTGTGAGPIVFTRTTRTRTTTSSYNGGIHVDEHVWSDAGDIPLDEQPSSSIKKPRTFAGEDNV